MSENRKETRQRTFLKGRILFNKGASSMDCLVRDLSGAGARLALTETSTLPDAFDLYIPQKDKTYRSALIWRRDDAVGITFVDEAAPVPIPVAAALQATPDDSAAMLILMRRVSELEAENAALRRLLTSLPAGGGSASPA
ncbi:PilZ domain-containing protein [Methylobacterium sp. BTF04]|uniref:PilZ domain-containing protein n=1 Tax=Methylobacterium sp. BTF04 TaxID=2708300 RepID=UPI0013D672B7|nr:PilZ domain-containing protein [Methylobacterium sp. BTF04]NEU13349.1 PilZ domain-containing protein [Methylobacterium sp. BTF04]